MGSRNGGVRPRVSTCKPDDLVRALGIDRGIGKSEASRTCTELDAIVRPFRERRLDHVRLPTCSSTPRTSRRTRAPSVLSKGIVFLPG